MAIYGRTHIKWSGNQKAINECNAAYQKLKPKRKRKPRRIRAAKPQQVRAEPEGNIKLTEELILQGMTCGAGIKRSQALLLGIKYPLRKGWKQKAVGTVVPKSAYEKFVFLKGNAASGEVDREYKRIFSEV